MIQRNVVSAEIAPPATGRERRSNESLERRFDALLRYTGGILFEFDAGGHYLDVCTADPSLLAKPESELVGRHLNEVLGEAGARPFIEIIQRVLSTGRPEEYEYVLDVPAGPRNFHATALASTERGVLTGAVTLLVRDVTEEKRVKAQLADAERLATVGLLAAAVGHEINNPLAFMANVLAGIDCARDPSLAAAVSQLKDGTKRIASIVGSLRLLGPSGATESVGVVEVERPLTAALELTRVRIEDRAKLMISVTPPSLVRGTEGKLCQVFVNLLLNATQAISPGAPMRNEISVAIEPVGQMVRIRITDSGIGIAEADMRKLFAPFFTTRPEQNGTGLGLYVTKKIVDSLGGSISMQSQVGRGTTVTVELPLAVRDANVPAPTSVTCPKTRRRILAIDDERPFLVSLRFATRPFADVECVNTVEEAIKLLVDERQEFDAVLCDLMMPGLNGIALHRELSRRRPELTPRTVFVTGGAFTDEARTFLETVRPRVLHKPFFPEELLQVVEEAALAG